MQATDLPSDDSQMTLTEAEAEQVKVAQRCIMMALDHSRAHQIAVLDELGNAASAMPAVAVPPRVLRLFAELLGRMAQGQPVSLVPQKYELSTQEAAALLNVSRPFVVKELEAKRIPFRKVGTHRRILFQDLVDYRDRMRVESDAALQALADQAQALKLGY